MAFRGTSNGIDDADPGDNGDDGDGGNSDAEGSSDRRHIQG